ncbi:MAG TPA: TMEM165/GDT1 family protein [Caulobacteraceae bacterium]|nr:TMEM165/GDT1 family protein [Caulobacteraceae bacterium]
MDAFLVSAGLVAIAEIGDKTMLLAICLAATWRKPVPILLGIFIATLLNHALAAGLGALLGAWLQGPWMKWILGLGFLGFAAWALIPDQFDDCPPGERKSAWGVFAATTVAFFLVEMGDKTQVATAALGARFPAEVAWVAAGTTLGMMIANAPAVLLGEVAAQKLPLKLIRWAAAACFAATGVWVLLAG